LLLRRLCSGEELPVGNAGVSLVNVRDRTHGWRRACPRRRPKAAVLDTRPHYNLTGLLGETGRDDAPAVLAKRIARGSLLLCGVEAVPTTGFA
jgi:hypothetical protein